jgi:hypothetical protein
VRTFNAIYSAGSSLFIDNSGVSITNNSIQDYYNPIGASNGINVEQFDWTISGNKFFQTGTRTATASAASHLTFIVLSILLRQVVVGILLAQIQLDMLL